MHARGRGRGRGQGQHQNSSDPTPSPQRQQPTQTTQRHSDPFNYDTQSLPYWDSSLPPSSSIPSTPPRHPARTYAQVVGGDSSTQNKFSAMAATIKPVQAQNPYAEIVGDGPYGKNGATYTSPTPVPTEPKAMRLKNKKVEFTPYFDPSDTRNDEDLRSPKTKDVFRPALSAKDENAKLRREARDKKLCNSLAQCEDLQGGVSVTKDKVQAAVEKRNVGALRKEKMLPAVPMSPAKESKPLSAIVEAPSPLKLSTKKSTNPRPSAERTPTLDQIVKLRAEEQAKALAALEGLTATVDVKDASSSVYSSDDEDDIEKLTQAVAGLRPFQDLPSSTPRTSFHRRSAVPEGLDMGKIKAVKGELEEVPSKEVPREKTSDETMAEVLEALEATEAAARGEGSLKESSSKESFATLSSDDYEQVGSPTELETDDNGVKRRWFKGFRKA